MLSCTLNGALLILLLAAGCQGADPNDWVNVQYVLKQVGSSASGDTSSARQTIERKADSTAKDGPFTITSSKIKPPSGDVHDYLSWAPYHWPDCNWCSKGSNHFANPNATDDIPPADGDGNDTDGNGDDNNDYDESVGTVAYVANVIDGLVHSPNNPSRRMVKHPYLTPAHHRIMRRRRAVLQHSSLLSDAMYRRGDPPDVLVPATPPLLPTTLITLMPTSLPDIIGVPPPAPTAPPDPLGSTTTRKGVAGTQAPAEAHAKTSQGKAACTPSPTKTLAPTATWTTCPYVVKDGKVNPDVKLLPGPSLLQNMPESVLFNTIAFALAKTQPHSQTATKFLSAFFLTPATLMHPNMNFGQLVRGPGKDHQIGTFTGILDFRALVKVVNAIQILKAVKSSDWSPAMDQGLTTWMKTYITWLQTSTIGKETAGKANNHLSFYVNQLAAAQIYVGDTKGASATLTSYFKRQFLDQIAASGEQPFEAVRTRPYHYRAFNLEAMITNAKLGDQLGINFWTAKTKYGATIQTALDYAIAQKPGSEDIEDIFPHVASIAAAYGDPKGKYQSFLQNKFSSYKKEAWYFYDQTAALPNSPAAQAKGKRSEDGPYKFAQLDSDTDKLTPFSNIPFECPAVFNHTREVELEDGLTVTCDQLKPLYEIAVDPEIVSFEYGL